MGPGSRCAPLTPPGCLGVGRRPVARPARAGFAWLPARRGRAAGPPPKGMCPPRLPPARAPLSARAARGSRGAASRHRRSARCRSRPASPFLGTRCASGSRTSRPRCRRPRPTTGYPGRPRARAATTARRSDTRWSGPLPCRPFRWCPRRGAHAARRLPRRRAAAARGGLPDLEAAPSPRRIAVAARAGRVAGRRSVWGASGPPSGQAAISLPTRW